MPWKVVAQILWHRTLQQKEWMIEFYNRQANEGIHADPVDGTRAMREKRLDLLKESQIRSWLSSYQQKQKGENERLAADLWQLQGQLTFSSWASTAASVKGNNLPTTASAATITPCTSATTQMETFCLHQDRCYFKFIPSIYHLSCSHPDSNPATFYLSCHSGFHPTSCYLSCHCKCQLTNHRTANWLIGC